MEGGAHSITVEAAHIEISGQAMGMIVGLGEADLRAVLEPNAQPGESSFGDLRSARLSVGRVEEFMHLYSILLGVLRDDQKAVDALIISLDASVPQTLSKRPKAKTGETETIYTRLRNELAHKRIGVSVDATKREMASRVPDLRNLVKEAIRLHS